jgi:hypothetical protein
MIMAGHYKAPVGSGGIVIGVASMARLFGRSERTLWRWIRDHGFPAARLPSGHMCTSTTLIDLWLLGRLKEVHAPTPGTFVLHGRAKAGEAMRIPARGEASQPNLGR